MSTVLTAQEPSAKYLVNLQSPLVRHFDLIAQAPGGVARLRELILTLAVQGKLVPQDPNDEPASELLKKIQTEKDRLISEGKIKRDKPSPKISLDDTPFVIPDSWSWIQLSGLAEQITKGTTPTTFGHSYTAAGINFVKIENIDRGRLNLERMTEFISHETHEIMGRSQLAAGDVLFSIAGTIGKTAVVLEGDLPANTNQALAIIKGAAKHVNQQFLLYALDSFVSDQVKAKARGGAMNNISLGDLSDLQISIPPLSEQSRIVTRIEELMQLCDALEASGQLEAQQHAQLVGTLLGTLTQSETPEALADNWQRIATHFDVLLDRPSSVDAFEQTILQLAVRGLLVPQDSTDEPASVLLQKIRTEKDHLITQGKIKRDKPLPPITDEEKPFELPLGWEWVRFGQIANIASNLVPPSLHPKKWQVAPDCIEKATGRLLHKRTVAQAEIVSPNHLFKPGQLLYSKIRPSLSKAVLVDFEGLCSADMYPIESQLDMEFLLLYILSEPFLEQVSIAENRVKMPKLNQEALVAFMVAVPPLVAQAKIVKRVSELRSLCTDLRERITAGQAAQTHLADALLTSK